MSFIMHIPALFVDFKTGEEQLIFYDQRSLHHCQLMFEWRHRVFRLHVNEPHACMFFVELYGGKDPKLTCIMDESSMQRILRHKLHKDVVIRNINRLSFGRRRSKKPFNMKPSRLQKAN